MSSSQPFSDPAKTAHRTSLKHQNQGGNLHGLGSSKEKLVSNTRGLDSSKRRSRVKRTIRRQQRDSSGYSFTDALVESLADVAQAFLYPEENPHNNKDNANTTTETVEMSGSDEVHSSQDEEEDSSDDSIASSTTERRGLDTRTPPPKLVGSPASFGPSSVKRPIPVVSSPRSGFEPVFPSSFGMNQPPPIARMRAPPPESAPESSILSNDDRYGDSFVADKHRKWRRQIKAQKKRLEGQEQDDTSLLTTCGPCEGKSSKSKEKSSKGQEPVAILAQLIRAPCADVEDVVTGCEEEISVIDEVVQEEEELLDNSLIDQSDDDESTNYGTSVASGESEYSDERQSDFTDERESDVTSGTEHTEASSSHVSSSGSTPALRGVLKASSFGSSSVKSQTLIPTEEEEDQSKSKNFIKSFIQELTQEGMLMIWHGPQGDSTAFSRPCGVVAHLDLGSPADGVYGGPQIVWQKQDGSDGGAIDLFDIQSMDTASLDMLEQYQFAIPGNTFFVVLNNGKHVVFEASSEIEANRFIHGLRWCVARLAFNLVVGNPIVCCELLSVKGDTPASPQSPLEEALWSKAMNDVTNHLVDKSLMKEQISQE